MERFLVFFGAIAGAWFLIKTIPRLSFASTSASVRTGRPTMSPEELRFFQVLRQAAPLGFEIWPKADLADFAPRPHEYVDFLLTQGPDRTPVLIVDLIDITAQGFRNQVVDSDLAGAIPTVRLNADGDYVAHLLRAKIERELGLEPRRAA